MRVKRRRFKMDSGHHDTEVKYTESPKYQCLEFLRKNSVELYLAYCGREICEAGHTYGPAARKEYLLHYVISGKGTFTANGKTRELNAHDAFLIMPEETTVYSCLLYTSAKKIVLGILIGYIALMVLGYIAGVVYFLSLIHI